MKDKPNKVTATLKVVVTGEFYDDDSTEETLRYAIEQDLEDAGFEVDVSPLKEQKTVPVKEDKISKCECGETVCRYWHPKFCGFCGRELLWY